MNTAQLEQHSYVKPRTSQGRATRLVRNGCWIILGVILPIGIWMGFAALCLVILETNVRLDNVLQQQAQLLFDPRAA